MEYRCDYGGREKCPRERAGRSCPHEHNHAPRKQDGGRTHDDCRKAGYCRSIGDTVRCKAAK